MPGQGRGSVVGSRGKREMRRGKRENRRTRGGNSLINATALLAPINASVFSASREFVSYNSV
jgi:hypothetical protein